MLISSVAFYYAFPASDYIVLDDALHPMCTSILRSFVHVANPCDILDEVPFVSPVLRLTADTVGKAASLFKSPVQTKRDGDDEAILLGPNGRAAGSSTEEENT
jgi:hypothetical protein